MHSDEWVKYLESNLTHIDGIIWADALLTHIRFQSSEINIKAQKFRAQMYYLKYQRQELHSSMMRTRIMSQRSGNFFNSGVMRQSGGTLS